MSSYESSGDLAEKADYEGGFLELTFGYGLTEDELPADMPEPVRAHFRRVLSVADSVEAVAGYLDRALQARYLDGNDG